MTYSIVSQIASLLRNPSWCYIKQGLTEEHSFYKMAMYKCDVCDKIFTEKRNVLRHEKNIHGEKNSYPCELCNKVYGRTEDLRRHKASTHYKSTQVQCSKCKKTFARGDNLKRHKCKLVQETGCLPDSNEAPLKDVKTEQLSEKTLVNMFPGDVSSIDEPPAKKRKYFKPDQHKLLENEELTESDPEVKDFMQKYWGSIRSFMKKGQIQNIYIFYDRDFKDLIETIAERIMTYQKTVSKSITVLDSYLKI